MSVSKAAIEEAIRIAFEIGYKKGRNDAKEGVLIDPSALFEYLIDDLVKSAPKDAPKKL